MTKAIFLSLFLFSISFALHGQMKPGWTWELEREENYPQKFFFTGYIEGNVRTGETEEDAKKRLLKDAQGLLSEKIRMTIKSQTVSQTISTTTNQTERFDAVFASNVQTASDVEIAGMRSEPPYYDKATGIVHAFVYVSRFELIGYHKGNIAVNIAQIEGLLQTAQDLETAGEKAKARQQCEAATPLLAKVRSAQDLLTAIDANNTAADLQQAKTEALYNRLAQMLARLAQAVLVYMESAESNFSKPTTVVANKLKSTLAVKGCSFTDNSAQADFRLKIEAATRLHGEEHGFNVCFADVAINLFDVHKNKSVFLDEFSQKGISTSQESAGRKALEDAAPVIANKISQWIE